MAGIARYTHFSMDAHNYRFGRVTERTLILAVEVGIYSLYFPISHYVINLSPVDVSTAFDRALPLWPSWIFIYVAIFYTAFLPLFLDVGRPVPRWDAQRPLWNA